MRVDDLRDDEPARSVDDVRWGDVSLRVSSYLNASPPAELITSARAVVVAGDSVLVVADPIAVHILPGGRLEPGETPEQAVRREVAEETGWSLGALVPLGYLRFRRLDPQPPTGSWRPSHPEFFQVVYLATAESHDPAVRETGGFELWSELRPIDEVRALALSEGERVFLAAALAARATER